jgi:GNAT superfamily N-acetyltransferase
MYTHASAGWSIRKMAAEDRDACLAIFRECVSAFPWRGDWQGQVPQLKRAFEIGRSFVATEPRAGTVGFLTLQLPQCYVDHLFVHEDWRFCGVARGLISVARRLAGKPLSLDVDLKNMGARRAYEALGWRVEARAQGKHTGGQLRLVSP